MYNIKSTITEDITDTNLETEVITRNCLQTPGLPTCKITMATVQNDGISIHHSVAIIVWNELIIGEQLSHSCTNEWGQSGIIDIDCISNYNRNNNKKYTTYIISNFVTNNQDLENYNQDCSSPITL